MNKKLFLGAMVAILIAPQITFAAWWNPFDWFNNWTFSRSLQISGTQALENQIKELEQKLNQVASTTATSTTAVATTSENGPFSTGPISKKQSQSSVLYPIQPIASIATPTQRIISEAAKSFTARCTLENDDSNWIGTKNPVRVSLRIWEGRRDAQSRYYSVTWKNSGEGKIKEATDKYAIFEFNKAGNYDINAEVIKTVNGEKQNAICPVSVYCNDYKCLSLTDKKKVKLNNIIEEIDSWYDSGDTLYSCSVAESIIRALEYDYTILGGQNIPVFNKTVDCASIVAPAAYRYKIEVLKESL